MSLSMPVELFPCLVAQLGLIAGAWSRVPSIVHEQLRLLSTMTKASPRLEAMQGWPRRDVTDVFCLRHIAAPAGLARFFPLYMEEDAPGPPCWPPVQRCRSVISSLAAPRLCLSLVLPSGV